MNSEQHSEHNHAPSGLAAWARRAATVGAVLGLGLAAALGVFAAPLPNSPATGTPYSWPGFHAGGTTDPTATTTGVLAPYYQLQGTPSGIIQPGNTGTNYYATQIPSVILGNYNPAQPPAGLTTTTPPAVAYFPNHFADGPTFSQHYYQINGPLGFLPPVSGYTADVQSSPTAVNATEYPDIANMKYYGEATAQSGSAAGTPDPTGTPHGAGTTNGLYQIRQVVYYGREEAVTAIASGGGVTVGGVPAPAGVPAGAVVNVGAIYAMDGFTGDVIWRYQTPSFSAASVVSATTRFAATLSGAATFNTATFPQPFQIGPTANPGAASQEGNTSLNGTAGTLTITNAPPANLPTGSLNFSLYATTATTTTVPAVPTAANNNATSDPATAYTGTFRIFQVNAQNPAATAANTGNVLEHGNFTLTVDNTTNLVTGQFTADVGTLQTSYAKGPVDFSPVTPAQVQVGGTFNSTTGALNIVIQAPPASTLQDAAAFSSVSVAKINVVTTAGATPVSKLVVIAADNNGFVYCLDAVGTGDGTSNSNVYTTVNGVNEIAYTAADATALGRSGHLGSTSAYWVYRPDPAVPHLADGTVDKAPSAAHDLPVPQAFNNASPTVFVDPTVTTAGAPNATVYIGNSNGVLYALDATGGVDPTAAAFNAARTGLSGIADATPTCNPKWWYAVSGTTADTGSDTIAIQSAPAVYVPLPAATTTTGGPTNGTGSGTAPVVYFGTSDSTGNNVGRLYAVNGTTGPTGPGGAVITPGTATYNVGQQGQWTFPSTAAGAIRPPLGDISGSPVVFLADGVNPVIYFAANTGAEYLNGAVVPSSPDTGRIWGVNLDGSYHFSYPNAGSPNAAADLTNGTFAPTNSDPPVEGFLRTTPAIGFVQFPTTTQYLDANGATQTYTVTPTPPASTPMLYFGTTGTNGGYFYGINIDPNAASTSGGTTTAGPDVIRVPGPNGASFVSSPILVTNPSTTPTTPTATDPGPGNGGAVFICTSAGQLLQYQATPTTTASASAPYPSPRLDYTFPYGGPISAPAVASANISAVVTALASATPAVTVTNGNSSVSDYVYVGDSNTGQCFGFTPKGFGTDTTGDYFPYTGPTVSPYYNAPPVVNQFPLRAFLFDDPSKGQARNVQYSAKSLSMDSSFGYGKYTPSGTAPTATNHSALPAFEWGQSVSVRIANVVPPGLPVIGQNNYIELQNQDNGTPPTGGSEDGTTTYYLGNGGPIQFQVADVTTAGSRTTVSNVGVSLSIPNTIITQTPDPPNPDPSVSNGFFERTDYGTTPQNFGPSSELLTNTQPTAPPTDPATQSADYRAYPTELLDSNGKGWAAAATYSIGANTAQDALGQQHPNTPGSRRQIINATQTYTLYTLGADGKTFTPVGQTPAGATTPPPATTNTSTQTLTLQANPAFSYALGGGSYPGSDASGTNPQGNGTIVVDQPTFGILNPLAVRGGGINLTASNGGAAIAPPWVDGQNNEGVGPFRAIVPVPGAPPSTVTTGTSTLDMAALANGNNVLQNPPASGVLGDVANPTAGTTALRSFAANYLPYYRYVITTTGQIAHGTTGDNSDPTQTPLPAPSGSDLQGVGYGPYLLDVADRSALGLAGSALNVSTQSRRMEWNDNSDPTTNPNAGGPAARINPLPWDDAPVQGQNASRDYPDIPASAVTFNLTSPLPGATLPATNGSVANRYINPQSTQVSIAVPRYQPANLQLDERAGTNAPSGIVPTPTNIADGSLHFPMGYVSRQRITATTGATTSTTNATTAATQNQGQAYRIVYVYTGVPVDMSTDIQNAVTDIGTVPHGFGVQMNAYVPSGAANPIGGFTPYNTYLGYAGHFLPLTVHNDGNTNLINPHLDQKFAYYNQTNNSLGAPDPLPLLSDALDTGMGSPLSYIPSYDYNGITGPPGTLIGTTPAQPFLVRSSLDTDLVSAGLGPNYGVTGSEPNYSTITFHKARVGDSQGTTMTIPDVPHDNTFGSAYRLVLVNSQPALVNGKLEAVDTDQTSPTYNQLVPATARPYVSVAVPLGTPVGNYSSNLQLFEGYDPNYNALIGPTYSTGTDILALTQDNTLNYHGVQTTSKPGTQLLVHVDEDRLTDSFTKGALPMIDAAPQANLASTATNNAIGTADFAPAAYRDPISGSLALYWTSARNYNPTANPPTPPYSIFGVNLPFKNGGNDYYTNTSTTPGYFSPASTQSWWGPVASGEPITNNVTGTNFATAVEQILNNGAKYNNNVYGFATTISGSGTTTQYAINCTPLTPGTGAVTNAGVPVTISTQPKSGVHGLTFNGTFPDAATNTGTINNNLWAFWNGGTRGRTALFYSSALTSNLAFTTPASLPVPGSLVSVADATATLVQAPDTTSANNNAVPAIEVTYAGVGRSGTSDLYVSRYRPYLYTPAGGAQTVLLGLMRMPLLTEQLQADPNDQWYQARDVGWARTAALQNTPPITVTLSVNSTSSNTPAPYTYVFDGNQGVAESLNGGALAQAKNAKVVYDTASGILALTNVDLPLLSGANVNTTAGQTLFIDLASGRVRFSQPLPAGNTAGVTFTTGVTATFYPTARRLTTGGASNTAPVAFLDQAYTANASGFASASGTINGVTTDPNVEADRYWVFWHKDAVGKTNPSLWYKTQRLTFAVTDPTTGQPVAIPLNNAGQPNVTVSVNGTQVYKPGGGTNNVVDVDAARGRIYFPITLVLGGVTVPTEGLAVGPTNQPVTVTVNGTSFSGAIHWLDEPQYNQTGSQAAAADVSAGGGTLVPINTITNESGVTAFLDPAAYANTNGVATPQIPHKVWLFWTSTRNGTADIYDETINPRFTANGQ